VTSHTAALTTAQVAILRTVLADRGFEFSEKPHAIYSASKPQLNVTVYQKGPKVLIQGKGTEEFIRFTLEPQVLGEATLGYEDVHHPEYFQPHFGIDESGKGDYFGPLVIAGTYTDDSITRALGKLGVMDSKRITTPARIRELAAGIRRIQGCHVEIVSIGPERYNEIYPQFGNLNRMLAWGHAKVIAKLAELQPDCPRALSDQFARAEVLQRALKQTGVAISLDQRTKGESDPAVAAASIIARERFIDWMDQTSKACGIKLPLGASSAVVTAAKELVKQRGPESLRRAAKLHFRTTQEVTGTTPPPFGDSEHA
jgi:ribonuclease HIII